MTLFEFSLVGHLYPTDGNRARAHPPLPAEYRTDRTADRSGRVLGEFGGDPDIIRADERKLKQVMYNLLSNAVKFTPDGGRIALTARPCQTEAEDPSAAGGYSSGHILISVSDSGAGLNPEDLDWIFLPFELAAACGHQKIQGTGLGLPLSRQLVELHGGKIWATSEGLQRGTTVYFTLPVKGF